MNSAEQKTAIIVAGGTGKRFGTAIPKQFALLEGKPVLQHTIERFRRILPSENILTVINKDWKAEWVKICQQNNFNPGSLVEGGSTRWESVKNGIIALNGLCGRSIILVHDAARPLVTEKIINDVIESIENGHDGAIPTIKVSDSLREIDGTKNKAADRSKFRRIQTPQGFRLSTLREAYKLPYSEEFTDEATMVQKAGYPDIFLTEGDKRNIKITESEDLELAKFYLHLNEES